MDVRDYAADAALDDLLNAYMRIVKAVEIIPEEVVETLFAEAQRGDLEARNRLVIGHLPLVVGIAKRWSSHLRHLTLLDLIQEGNLGLILAACSIPEVEKPFRLFAASHIHNAIQRAVQNKERTIRLPVEIDLPFRQIQALAQESLDVEQIAARVGLSAKRVRDLLPYVAGVLSLERPASPASEEETLADLTPAPEWTPSEQEQISELLERMDHAALTEREREFLLTCLGLDGSEQQTLRARTQAEASKLLGISSTRGSQLFQQALRKVRAVV